MTSMSAHPATSAAAPAQHDVRAASRLLAAILLPVGPALIAALRFVLPYDTTDSGKEIVRQVATHHGAANAVVWLGFGASLLMVPTVLWVGRIAGRTSPRLTAVALVLLVPAYASLALLVSSDAIVLYAVKHGISESTAADMYTSVHPIAAVAAVLFVVGHVLGTILLGIALLRGRMVPTWAAAAVIVAQPLHFVAAIIVGNHPLDLAAWGLNAVGFAAVSAVILALSDDDWAPRPAPAAEAGR